VGDAGKIDSIEVSWPRLNKRVQVNNAMVNQAYQIVPSEE